MASLRLSNESLRHLCHHRDLIKSKNHYFLPRIRDCPDDPSSQNTSSPASFGARSCCYKKFLLASSQSRSFCAVALSRNQPYRRLAHWFKPARKAQGRFLYHFGPPPSEESTRDLN